MFKLAGIPIYWQSILVFVVALVATTEIVKRKIYWPPIVVSWIVGGALFPLVHLVFHESITLVAVAEFAAATFLTNGGYKILKPAVDWIVETVKSFSHHWDGGDGGMRP